MALSGGGSSAETPRSRGVSNTRISRKRLVGGEARIRTRGSCLLLATLSRVSRLKAWWKPATGRWGEKCPYYRGFFALVRCGPTATARGELNGAGAHRPGEKFVLVAAFYLVAVTVELALLGTVPLNIAVDVDLHYLVGC